MVLTTECFVARCVTTDEAVAPDCFGFRDVDVPELPPNGLLIRTKFIGLEPYMRIWGIGPQGWGLDNVMDRWRAPVTWVVADEKTLVEKLDPTVEPRIYLGLAGSGGRSAKLPLERVARPSAGQVAVVTAAAGTVGLAACQLMKLDGVDVVGTAGTDEKKHLIESLGCKAFNYKTDAAADALKRLAPKGVDFLFDNVAGAIRTAVVEAMNSGAQILTSGRIAQYDAAGGAAGGDEARDAAMIREKKIADHGQFYVGNWESEFVPCTEAIVALYKAGKLVSKDTVAEGFRSLPDAFVGIFIGRNVGRMVVAC
ncbi:prostaglandin reductase [Aureococcus anophagefferens]|nr:prostaglandin reductase [Aureococcus anophagefferens]